MRITSNSRIEDKLDFYEITAFSRQQKRNITNTKNKNKKQSQKENFFAIMTKRC